MSDTYLTNKRSSASKPFSIKDEFFVGRSERQDYLDNSDYKEVKGMYDKCLNYAESYTKIMLNRALIEDPEVFAVKGISRKEMHMNLVHNMCLPYKSLHARAFRDQTVRISEKNYLNDEMRRLSNGGDKFHPYL